MSLNNPIGGYFEIEMNDLGSIFHDRAIAVNSGRNALELILRNISVSKIQIPYYICDVILQPIKKAGLNYSFYHLDNKFNPVVSSVNENDVILYVNYFGIFNQQVRKLSKQYRNLIIDNSQAFFSDHLEGTYSFYSPRKFFGVPDGGFVYMNNYDAFNLETDESLERFSHLLKRVENSPEKGYIDFKENEAKLNNLPIKSMSRITNILLRNIDYQKVIKIRNENFNYLHKNLKKDNELSYIINGSEINGPMVYPYLNKNNTNLRDFLIKNKIFVATYWPNVPKWVDHIGSLEFYLSSNLIPLPIDQRYNETEMEIIIGMIKNGRQY